MFRDPVKNMRLARRLFALSLGISEDEIPDDAAVEMSHDHATETLRVVGTVTAKACLRSVTFKVAFVDKPPSRER